MCVMRQVEKQRYVMRGKTECSVRRVLQRQCREDNRMREMDGERVCVCEELNELHEKSRSL